MPTLEVDGLSKRYGDLVAVDSLSLTARPGHLLALLGPNGAGKSTTIGMICGLLRADAGQVRWDGRAVEPRQLRRLVGMCPQEIEVWPRLSCREQLAFLARLYGVPKPQAGERIDLLLADVGLTDRQHSQARTLSGGLQRRLNLAMALVNDPALVVLDEPEAGLDPQSRVLIRELIARLARDKTVILTSHDMDEVDRLADEVLIVDHGRPLATGTPSELKTRHGGADLEAVFLTLTGRGLRE